MLFRSGIGMNRNENIGFAAARLGHAHTQRDKHVFVEFNVCITEASETNFNNAKKKYQAKGYRLPDIVFWNVASRNRQQPVTLNEQGVALISGVTPRIFSMVAGGKFSPYLFMMEVLNSERYAAIAA